ncbi:hypothetical protein [Nocardia abscessus]|uniref:hypothetical protein n=1 Tax=Nocardia abscessus TaxID=120957 RepID=UPI0024590EC9|nr:hypothetical protein [Nocardia abscessus]
MTAELYRSSAIPQAIPDVYLDAEHISAAQRVLERVVGSENTRLAFVSGSLAAGLGHGMSDIDVYVSAEPGVDVPDRSYREDRWEVQINPISVTRLEEMARVCAQYAVTTEDRWQADLSDPELVRAVHYAIGTVLIDRDSGMPSAQQSRRTLRQVLMTKQAWTLAGLIEDALGALQVGDGLTAAQASLMAVEEAVQCALIGAGDLYIGRKFLLRRLARCVPLRSVLPQILDALHTSDHSTDLSVTEQLVTRRSLLCGHLVAHAVIECWESPGKGFADAEDRSSQGGPTRSPWTVPVRLADSWGLVAPDTGYSTTEGLIRIWRELDGRPVGQIHRDFEGDEFLTGTPPDVLDAAITQLVECGVAAYGGERVSTHTKGG